MNKTLSYKGLGIILSIVYFASYITRINFAAIISSVIFNTGYLKSDLSVILVVLFVTYGFGQIINGILGDKFNPKKVITIGLLLACIINLIFPLFSHSIALMSVLWGINGFAQAMLWPPIVRIMVSTLNEEQYNETTSKVIKSSSLGTIFVYLVSPLMISLFNWKSVFIMCAIMGIIAFIIWYIFQKQIEIKDVNYMNKEKEKIKLNLPNSAFFPLVFIFIAIILQGMLRDGITSWMPSYLVDVFSIKEELSILITLSQAIITLIALEIFSYIYKKFFDNEVLCATFIFVLISFIVLLLLFTYDFNALISTILMALIIGAVHGVNLMLVCHVPKRFKKYGSISTISGVINSFTYIGSAISTYGIALLVENSGWNITILVWLIISLLGLSCCLLAYNKWKIFYKK